MGTGLNYLGILLIAIGTLLMFRGNQILSKERDKLLVSQVNHTMERFKEFTNIKQIELRKNISSEHQISSRINHLSELKKIGLVVFSGFLTRMNQKEAKRILKSLEENLKLASRSRFISFADVINSLRRKELVEIEGKYIKLTPIAIEVITVMRRDKIPSFDFKI